MPAFDRSVKVTCGNCGNSVTKQQPSRHKSRYSGGTLHCANCPNFSTKSRDDVNFHMAKKHATPRVKTTQKCEICFKEFSGFYALRQHKTREHGIQMKSAELDVNNLEDDVADLKEELQACQHFFVDSELEKGRHRVFNFAMSTFDISLINKKLDLVFNGLKCAAKVNLAFGFVLGNVEDGSCRYFYAHENNTLMERSISKIDIGDLMKEYAEKGNMSQPRRTLISSFYLKNRTIITPLLLYYLHLGLECTKIYRFVQYTPKKCFSSFVQSAVNARRQGDENPNSSVVAETMKLLANSSYGYQIMDRSRHTLTKYLNDEKTHSAINNKLFKRLNFINHQLCEVELVKSEIEHREPIIVGFFILQYAQLRMLELYYIFFKKFCYTEKYEEVEMDTDSLYLALSGENLEDIILPEKRNEWEAIRSRDCTDTITANATGNFLPRTCCSAHKKHDNRKQGLFKEEFRCTDLLCLCSKTYCCYDRKSNKYKLTSKGLNKGTLEDCGDGPMTKYRKVLEEAVNVTSTNRGFRTTKHSVATYEQTKKGLS